MCNKRIWEKGRKVKGVGGERTFGNFTRSEWKTRILWKLQMSSLHPFPLKTFSVFIFIYSSSLTHVALKISPRDIHFPQKLSGGKSVLVNSPKGPLPNPSKNVFHLNFFIIVIYAVFKCIYTKFQLKKHIFLTVTGENLGSSKTLPTSPLLCVHFFPYSFPTHFLTPFALFFSSLSSFPGEVININREVAAFSCFNSLQSFLARRP